MTDSSWGSELVIYWLGSVFFAYAVGAVGASIKLFGMRGIWRAVWLPNAFIYLIRRLRTEGVTSLRHFEVALLAYSLPQFVILFIALLVLGIFNL